MTTMMMVENHWHRIVSTLLLLGGKSVRVVRIFHCDGAGRGEGGILGGSGMRKIL